MLQYNNNLKSIVFLEKTFSVSGEKNGPIM